MNIKKTFDFDFALVLLAHSSNYVILLFPNLQHELIMILYYNFFNFYITKLTYMINDYLQKYEHTIHVRHSFDVLTKSKQMALDFCCVYSQIKPKFGAIVHK